MSLQMNIFILMSRWRHHIRGVRDIAKVSVDKAKYVNQVSLHECGNSIVSDLTDYLTRLGSSLSWEEHREFSQNAELGFFQKLPEPLPRVLKGFCGYDSLPLPALPTHSLVGYFMCVFFSTFHTGMSCLPHFLFFSLWKTFISSCILSS